MTDKPEKFEASDEKKDDLYDVFDDLRESLAVDEEKEEQISLRRKKSIFKSLKSLRFPKLFKKKEVELSQASEKGDEIADASTEEDLFEMEKRLATEYPDETETAIEEELPDDAEEFVEVLDESEEAEDAIDEEEKVSRLSETLETDADHIRDIALEDYTEEELEEVDERKIAWLDFIQTPSSQMRRVEWAVILFVGILAGGIFIWLGIRSSGGLRLSDARPTPTPDPNVPVPASVQLPGGWTFRLGKGSLNADNLWEPYGAEWLQGTEICKWIALPWSTQLEAVIRTLEAGDPIEITMSNYDILTYHVHSRQKVDGTHAEALNLDIPSVLIILSSEDSDQKWALTAVLDYEDD